MKIVSYNLRLGGKAGARAHWQRIFEATAADIFLVQETRSPDRYASEAEWPALRSRVHWSSVPNITWGSAIYLRSGRWRAIDLDRFKGYVVGVELMGPKLEGMTRRPLRVFSLHVPSPYKRPMHEILDRIAALPNAQRCDHIIGGDFNLTTGVRHPTERRQVHDLWLLDRMRREFNLLNAWQVANPNRNLPQTLRWGKDHSEPYHCDAIFLPAAWYRYLESCEVISGPDWDALSDHNPVVASLSF
ncbi:MAG: endonuclease/exonuclease/phosphatase family protein [Acidobacteriota bacterium]